MRSISGKRLLLIPAIPFGIALVSGTLFAMQGGFGGGHGPFDFAIGALAFPWAYILFPTHQRFPDFFNLILAPLLLNLLIAVVLVVLLRNVRR